MNQATCEFALTGCQQQNTYFTEQSNNNEFPERSATLLNFVGFQIFLLNYGLYTCTSDRFWSIYMKGDNPLLPDNVLTG